jgi:hypothetical protein
MRHLFQVHYRLIPPYVLPPPTLGTEQLMHFHIKCYRHGTMAFREALKFRPFTHVFTQFRLFRRLQVLEKVFESGSLKKEVILPRIQIQDILINRSIPR